jgi:hypothetical protein
MFIDGECRVGGDEVLIASFVNGPVFVNTEENGGQKVAICLAFYTRVEAGRTIRR